MRLTRRQMLAALPLLGVAGKAAAQAGGDVPRIEAAELRALLAKGEAVVIDVRETVSFDTGHIEGARSVPLSRLGELAKDLPKDKLIAAYCTWAAEATSARAALQLKEAGFSRVAAIKGGLNAWQQAGGKVVVTNPPK